MCCTLLVCQVCYDKLLSSLSESLLVSVFGSVLLERRVVFCAQRLRYDSAAVAVVVNCNVIVCYLPNSNSAVYVVFWLVYALCYAR